MSEPRDGSAPGSEWTPTQPNADALPEGASDSLEQPEAEAAEAPVAPECLRRWMRPELPRRRSARRPPHHKRRGSRRPQAADGREAAMS